MQTDKRENKRISIVTATYNAVKFLPNLIKSLSKQTDKNFQWVVADGASTDGTLELLKEIKDIDVLVLSNPDFGIYDALNRAIKSSNGDYYIVSGADDSFNEDAIELYRKAINETDADIIVAKANFRNKTLYSKNSAPWLWGHRGYIASHSLATAFKKNLHDKFGYYSRKFPIAADQLFVLSACSKGAKRVDADFIVGNIGDTGVSSIDMVGNATEVYRVQLDLGSPKWLQTILLLLRLFRSY